MKADIMQMAQEARLPACHTTHPKALERFAKMVASRCADIANTAEPYKADDLIRKHFGVDDEPRTGAT